MTRLHGLGRQTDKGFQRSVVEKLHQKRETLNLFLGYKTRTIPPIINKKIEEEIELIEEYLEMEFEYKVFQEDGRDYALIVYSLGRKIDELMKAYMDNTESIRALIVDKLSILILDCIQEYIFEEIENKLGLFRVKEWYPGNKGFPIENQQKILRTMDSIKSICINEHGQLNPMKSVALKVDLANAASDLSRRWDSEKPCELEPGGVYGRKELYHSNREAFHQLVFKQSQTPYEDFYYIYKEIALDVKKKYENEGIAEEIYVETMTDLDVWGEAYKREYGVLGIKEYKWIEKSLDMKIFKLGRLQFEPVEDQEVEDFIQEWGFSEEILVLNTHIQAGQALDFDLCQKSYKQAVDFFKTREGQNKKIVFVCDSWLLNPKLANLLGADTNIAKFQKQYQILSENLNNHQIEKRLFQQVEADPKRYKATTSLQKHVKDCLMKGEQFGSCKGVNTSYL